MTIWFGSDFHLNHDKLWLWGERTRQQGILRRQKPFEDVGQMNVHILHTVYSQVKYGDTVYFLGDIAMSYTKFEWVYQLFRELDFRGVKIVWHLGNHDNSKHPKMIIDKGIPLTWIPMKEVRPLAEDDRFATSHFPLKGTAHKDGELDERESHLPFVTHEKLVAHSVKCLTGPPGCACASRILLHGHTHSKNRGNGYSALHVGFDAWGRLVSLQELIKTQVRFAQNV